MTHARASAPQDGDPSPQGELAISLSRPGAYSAFSAGSEHTRRARFGSPAGLGLLAFNGAQVSELVAGIPRASAVVMVH